MKKAIMMTARVGSSRLPKKHLLKIQNKYCIEHCIERAKKSKEADGIILCTTTLEEDDILVDIAKIHNIKYYRGSVEDKLDRWYNACKEMGVEYFVTFDADDLFCEPILIDKAFRQRERKSSDFIELSDKYLCGCFTYGISFKALEQVCKNKKSNSTEMMWVFFEGIKKEYLERIPKIYKRTDIRMTMDYEDDYQFFKRTIEGLSKEYKYFSLKEIVSFLDEHPEIIDINKYWHDIWKENQNKKIKIEREQNR